MPATVSLDQTNRRRGLLALGVMVLDQDPLTSQQAQHRQIEAWDGGTAAGPSGAAVVLAESLRRDPIGWSQWLRDPAHVNAATCMHIALTQHQLVFSGRDDDLAPVRDALVEIADQRATRRALAQNLAESGDGDQMINIDSVTDLRTGLPSSNQG